jgi:hypothetical protein
VAFEQLNQMYNQLGLEVMCKGPKKKEEHLFFMNFGVNKFTIKKASKKENFDVQTLQICESHRTKGCNLLRLIYRKVV